MSYNFPSPSQNPFDRPKPKRWPLLLALIAGVVIWKNLPTSWQPSPVSKRLPTVSSPTPRPTQRAPKPQISKSSPPSKRPAPRQPQIAPPKTPRADASEFTPPNLPLRLPGAPQVREIRDAKIAALEAKIAKYPVFALYRDLAARHLELGNTQAAARVFRTQATLYRRKGLEDAAQILEKRAAQDETTLRIFAARTGPAPIFTGAPLEPKRGAYLGAFIDRDDALATRFQGDNWQNHRLPSEFEARTGRRHATVFTYVKWGNFPCEWLQMCKREGVIPHIAWEPQNLGEVRDDAYLRACGQFLRELDWPVFVRFAGEMNGDWTPYHGNPALYREKFRLVHRTLHRYAAKVATIWCVNAIPLDNIDSYYPGDTGCDWVGVNLYSTPFADNDRTREAFRESPLTLIDPIYKRYSARKPVAICEYAASHQSAVDGVVRGSFATEKMALLYGALPLLYPRIKMINWFSTNNLIHARAGRQLNNYRLTQLPEIQKAYRQLTASAHFLTNYGQGNGSSLSLREIGAERTLRRGERVHFWVTSTTARPTVVIQAGTRIIYAGRRVGKHVLDLETPSGTSSLSILVYDARGRCQMRREVKLSV